MVSLKGRKVGYAIYHTGVSVGPKVVNSSKVGKDFVVELQILEHGIYVKSEANERIYEDVIPFSNVVKFSLVPEEVKESAQVKKLAG